MAEIKWPWQYNFPPFFTLQPHLETKSKQIAAWKSLILDYFKANRLCVLDVEESRTMPLFNNAAISRNIERKLLHEVLDFLQSSGNAAPVDKARTRWEIYWHTLDEFGLTIYNYVSNSNQLNTVLTIYELTESEDVENEEFYKLNSDICIKALRRLEDEGKCELILFDDNQGVKFF